MIAVAGLAALLGAATLQPAMAQSDPAESGSLPGPVVAVSGTSAEGSFAGSFGIRQFSTQDEQLVAVGTLNGTLTDAQSKETQAVSDAPLVLPVAAIQGTCQTLHVEFAPQVASLLGLTVQLGPVVFERSSSQEAGDMRGYVLCALATMLETGTTADGQAQLLNLGLRYLI
jgi:hypothetical protein